MYKLHPHRHPYTVWIEQGNSFLKILFLSFSRARITDCIHTVYVKKNTILIKIDCAAFLIQNALHFYGLPLDFCGKRIAVLFAERTAIFANVPQFGKTCRVFMGKTPQSLEKRRKTPHFLG